MLEGPGVTLGRHFPAICFVFWDWGFARAACDEPLFQFALAVFVLSLILPKSSQYIKWIVSAGLAQVSEFSFVLGSRARRAGIISREVSVAVQGGIGPGELSWCLCLGVLVSVACSSFQQHLKHL